MPRLRLLLVVVLGLLALAPAAGAASRNTILKDCEDDSKLAGSYSDAELRDAQRHITSALDAYSDCRDVIRAALEANARRRAGTQNGAGAGGGAGTGGTGVGGTTIPGTAGGTAATGGTTSPALPAATPAAPATPAEAAELRTARERLPHVDVRGQRVVPGVRGVAGEAASSSIPASLVTVLILLGACALAGAATLVRRRVLGRRAP